MNIRIRLLLLFVFTSIISKAQTLQEAISKKDTVLAAKLIKEGADPNQKDTYGATLLSSACRWGKVDEARFLINHGATVNEPRTPKGRTPLMVACAYYSDTIMLKLLIEKGAQVNLTSDDGTTALMLAAQLLKSDVVNFLIAHGADVKLKNKAGQSAFDLATKANMEDWMKAFKEIRFDKEQTIESLKSAMK